MDLKDKQFELFAGLELDVNGDGGIRPGTLGGFAQCSDRQAARYWLGECLLTLPVIHNVICNHRSPTRLRDALLRFTIPEVSGYEVRPIEAADLDVNRDGRVTPEDALAAAVAATAEAAQTTKTIADALADRKITAKERRVSLEAIDSTIRQLRIARRVLERQG